MDFSYFIHTTITIFQSFFCAQKEDYFLKKRNSLEGFVSVRFFDIKSLKNGDGHVYKEII